jgi:hypothetical protein
MAMSNALPDQAKNAGQDMLDAGYPAYPKLIAASASAVLTDAAISTVTRDMAMG